MDDFVKCKFCGEKTMYTATKLCNNCWEVSIRLDGFLCHPRARWYTIGRMLSLVLGHTVHVLWGKR